MLHVETKPFAGSERPVVTRLLRAVLYVLASTPAEIVTLRPAIEAELPHRNDIVIRAKLLSLIGRVVETPWAFPTLLDTPKCKRFRRELAQTADAMGAPSETGGDAVTGLGVGRLLKSYPALAFGAALLNQFSGQSKNYYDFYVRRIDIDLALRGIPAHAR